MTRRKKLEEGHRYYVRGIRGIPFATEHGGWDPVQKKGLATIIAGPYGEPKAAGFSEGRLFGPHAHIPLAVGDWVIEVHGTETETNVDVYQVRSVDAREDTATLQLMYQYRSGELYWQPELPGFLMKAVMAAIDKAYCENCSEVHYALRYDGVIPA